MTTKVKKTGGVLLSLFVALCMVLTMMPLPAKAADGVKYIKMNVPYKDFWAAYSPDDVAMWEVDPDNLPGIDAVSTATKSKFKGTTGLGRGTWNDGTYVRGVAMVCAVSEADYEKLDDSLKLESGAEGTEPYNWSDLAEEPEYYSTVTVSEDGYSFSKIQDSDVDTSYIKVGDVEPNGQNAKNAYYVDGQVDTAAGYGDYQITLAGFTTTYGLQTSGESILTDIYEKFNGMSDEEKASTFTACTIYGATINTNKGTFGMTALENLWFGGRRPYVEIAWSVPHGQQLKNHGGVPFYQFANANGATINSVTLITDLGVMEVVCGEDGSGIKATEYYAGDLSKLSTKLTSDSKEMTISGVPSDLENPVVTISYKVGSGRQAQTKYLVREGEINKGKVLLDEEPADGIAYTMTIYSDNFPGIIRTIATSMSNAQKGQLLTYAELGKAAAGYEDNATLKEHVAEAEEMASMKDVSSTDAAELIGEIKALVESAYEGAETSLDEAIKNNADSAVKEAEAIDSSKYTEDSYKAVVAAKENLAKVLADENATTDDIFAAKAVLSAAMANLADKPANPPAAKKANPMKVTVKAKTYKAKKLKKKKATYKAVTVKNAQGKVTYKVSGTKKAKKVLKFNAKNGKVTVKKKAKKGTYKLKIQVKAAGNANFNALTKNVTVKVKVK